MNQATRDELKNWARRDADFSSRARQVIAVLDENQRMRELLSRASFVLSGLDYPSAVESDIESFLSEPS